ncbi:MAG: hypothetical protein WKG32_01890 [Gemmatimonadaceae bacterium]
MRAGALYAVVAAGLIGAAAWALALRWESPAELRTIRISAAVAFGVQLLTFSIARLSVGSNVIAGWGIGVLIRLVTIALFALVMTKAIALATLAPLFLFVFLFVTTIVEPLFLKP